jgi:hypothetical protein
LLAAVGADRTARYLVDAVQSVYRAQGATVHDKHVEVIVRQMLRAVRVEAPGDTALLPGELVDRAAFAAENDRTLAQGGVPAIGAVVLLGITRAGQRGDGFLAAAAFQQTARVLARAALARAVDPLRDLTGNVVLGRRQPVGAGRGGAQDGPAWRLAVDDAEPAPGGDDRLVAAAPGLLDDAEDEIDARSLAALLAGLQATAEAARSD